MPDVPTLRFEVVIAGGGFAGVYAARALAKKLRPAAATRVALIADENYMVFQPMLAEVVGSSVSPRHVVNPLRRLCGGVTTLRGRVTDIDLETRALEMNAGDYSRNVRVEFDHLALTTGSVVDLSRVPGMPEHAFVLKNVGDALDLRSAIIDRFEEANLQSDAQVVRQLLTFVVVGGGYSGVETAGQLVDLIKGVNRLYPRIAQEDYRVILVHSREHLLPEVSRPLAEYAEKTLRRRGVELLLSQRVRAMTTAKVFLTDGGEIATHTVVSTVGNAPHPVIARLCERFGIAQVNGRVAVSRTLRVASHDFVWAAGDCAAVPFADSAHDDQQPDHTCPPTAQFAQREGKLLGQNIARVLRGQQPRPFSFRGLGELASIGHRSAIADVFGLKFSGLTAWFLWRTVYLAKLPGLERKLRVMIDWTLDLFFPRDIALLRPRPTDVVQKVHLEPGDRIFSIGEPALSFYIVKSGRVELKDAAGVIRSLGPGEHFGERALLEDKAWNFSACAMEPSELVSLSREVFDTISLASPSIHSFFEKSAARFITRREADSLVAAMPREVQAMRVADLMQAQPVTMCGGLRLREALAMMVRHPYNSFPYVDDRDVPLGLISQSDIYNALKRSDLTLDDPLSRLTPSSCATIPVDASVSAAIEGFYRSGRNKLLVTSDGRRLCGVITPIDLLSHDGAAEGR